MISSSSFLDYNLAKILASDRLELAGERAELNGKWLPEPLFRTALHPKTQELAEGNDNDGDMYADDEGDE